MVDADTLYRRFHAELRGFLMRRIPSEAAVEDILQGAFLRAHKRLADGDQPENPRAWLYQIVRNLAVDAQRYAGRQSALAARVASDPTFLDSAEPDNVFEVVARALPLFIGQLEPPYREALVLTELEGLTQREVAEKLGIGLSALKSRVQRGRKQIRDALNRCCEFELDARGRMISCEARPIGDCC